MTLTSKLISRTATAAIAVSIGASSALAGGFFVREQGALGQGASFAGAGASTALSAMFMNSAAVTSLDGMNSDSNIAAILPEATMTATAGSTFGPGTAFATTVPQSTDIGVVAYVPASYINYQFKNYDPNLYLGLAVNSPFGLKTKPDTRWAGSTVADSTRLFSVNFNPTLGYKLSNQLSVGVGAQFEYAKGVLKFATGTPTGPHSGYEGDSMAVGATAGLMYTPNAGTRIGLGYRSQMTHTLEGSIATGGSPTRSGPLNAALNAGAGADVDLRLPDIVNLSINQAVSNNMRVLGTVEWAGWSRFKSLDLVQTSPGIVITKAPTPTGPGTAIGSISGKWEDGWFFSGGLEYDVSPALTVRAGGAYEISPVTSPKERIASIPDADRIWASLGFSYNVSQTTTVDFGYSHVFVDSVKVDRTSLPNAAGTFTTIKADLDASVDIISLGLRMKLN